MTMIHAPVITIRGPSVIDLVPRKTQRLAPISERFADIISDPDTIAAVFTAWEAAYHRWGPAVAKISIDLSNESLCWLEACRWTLQGDSLGLAAHLCILTDFQNDFEGYSMVIASGAIDSTSKGYKVRGVGKISEKLVGIRDQYADRRIALVLPEENQQCFTDISCDHDLWLAGRELGKFQPLVSRMVR